MILQSEEYLGPKFKEKKSELEALQKEIKDAMDADPQILKKKAQLPNKQVTLVGELDTIINGQIVGKRVTNDKLLCVVHDEAFKDGKFTPVKFNVWLQKSDRDDYKKSSNFANSLQPVCEFDTFPQFNWLCSHLPILSDPLKYMTDLSGLRKARLALKVGQEGEELSPTWVEVSSMQVIKGDIRPEWEDKAFNGGCQVCFMLEPAPKWKKEDEDISVEAKRDFMQKMQQDVSFIWKNLLLAFILSDIEHAEHLLAIRIVDKCNVKPDKKGLKRSNGFSQKVELWQTEKIKEVQESNQMLELKKYQEKLSNDFYKDQELPGMLVTQLTFTVKDINLDQNQNSSKPRQERRENRYRYDNYGYDNQNNNYNDDNYYKKDDYYNNNNWGGKKNDDQNKDQDMQPDKHNDQPKKEQKDYTSNLGFKGQVHEDKQQPKLQGPMHDNDRDQRGFNRTSNNSNVSFNTQDSTRDRGSDNNSSNNNYRKGNNDNRGDFGKKQNGNDRDRDRDRKDRYKSGGGGYGGGKKY